MPNENRHLYLVRAAQVEVAGLPSLSGHVIPPEVLKKINITFDTGGCLGSQYEQEREFIEVLMASHSSDLETMQHVLAEGPYLSFHQIEELKSTWAEEVESLKAMLYQRLSAEGFGEAECCFKLIFNNIKQNSSQAMSPLIASLKREYGVVRDIDDGFKHVGELRKQRLREKAANLLESAIVDTEEGISLRLIRCNESIQGNRSTAKLSVVMEGNK